MAKGSDNPFPSLLLVEGAAPAAPAAGRHRLFIDAADNKVKRVDETGAVSTVEGGSGASATDKVASATRTAGDVAIASSGYLVVDAALDLTVTAAAGEIVMAAVGFIGGSQAADLALDFVTRVAAADVNFLSGGAGNGIASARLDATADNAGNPGRFGAITYQLVAGDISSATVTVRLVAKSSGTRSILASTTNRLHVFLVNLGAP